MDDDLTTATGKIHCDDCLHFLSRIAKHSMGVAVLSPPYNLKNSTGAGLKSVGGKWPNAALKSGYADYSDDISYSEYITWQRQVLDQLMRVLKPDGAIFYNHKWRVQDGLLQYRDEIVAGFPVRQIIIWRRKGGINFNPHYFLPTYEVIYLIAKPDFVLSPKANRYGDVWDISQVYNNAHPAPFPVELARRCIEASPSGVVIDPFMGSGTTAVAAEECHRDWIGCEISQQYIDLAETRLKIFHDNRNFIF